MLNGAVGVEGRTRKGNEISEFPAYKTPPTKVCHLKGSPTPRLCRGPTPKVINQIPVNTSSLRVSQLVSGEYLVLHFPFKQNGPEQQEALSYWEANATFF